jgi:arylsulfatase A-like enzyme
MDPHGPYTPPPELEAAFAPEDPGPELAPPPGPGQNNGNGFVPWYQAVRETHHLNEYVGRYDGEIAYMDRELARLFAKLRELGRYDDALIVLTADHGEALGEGGFYFCHGQHATPDQSFVPMVVKHPLAPPGTRVASPVGHLDVFRTLAAELEEQPDPRGFEQPLDLVLAAREAPPTRPLYCDLGRELGVYVDDLVLTGIVKDGQSGEAGPEALARTWLALRPGADASAAQRPEVKQRLSELAREYLRQPPIGRIRLEGDDAALREALESLGYTGD